MNFLLIRNDVLGDAIVSSTFIETLAKSVKNCKIDILCNEYNEIAFRHNPYLNQIYILNHQQCTKQLAINLDSIVKKINQQNITYEILFILNPCFRNLNYANLIKNKRFVIARELITRSYYKHIWILWHRLFDKFNFVPNQATNTHEVINLYGLLNKGLTRLNITPAPLPLSCKFFLNNQIEHKIKQSCVINISGKNEYCRYLNDTMIYALLDNLSKYNITEILLISTENDRSRITQILAKFSTLSIKLLITSDLINLANEITQYQIFISSDGGLVHLAAGLGLACITLFDKQDKSIWHPWTPTQISLQSPNKNIYDISYNDVLDAITQLQII